MSEKARKGMSLSRFLAIAPTGSLHSRLVPVGKDYLIVDWAYQTDPGNPELVRGQ